MQVFSLIGEMWGLAKCVICLTNLNSCKSREGEKKVKVKNTPVRVLFNFVWLVCDFNKPFLGVVKLERKKGRDRRNGDFFLGNFCGSILLLFFFAINFLVSGFVFFLLKNLNVSNDEFLFYQWKKALIILFFKNV